MFSESNNYLKNPLFNPFFQDIYYIFEYGAVPAEIRSEFKKRILKRKGAGFQKNITLINGLEDTINSGGSSKYPAELIKKLGCSKRMFDCHKSRLLKQLRLFYFNPGNCQNESFSERIDRLFRIGMLKEAKNEILKFLDDAGKKRKSLNDKIILFDFCDKLYHYFSYNNEARKCSFYYKQAVNLHNKIIRSSATDEIKTGIQIRLLFLKSYKLTANRFKINNLKKAARILENILKKHSNRLNTEQKLKIHHRLGMLYYVFKEKDHSVDEFKTASAISEENSLTSENLVYTSFIMLRKFSENNDPASEFLEFHKNNFDKIIRCHTDISQVMEFELNYLRFLIYSGDESTEKITADYLNRQILYSRKSDALSSWYLDLSDEISSNIAKFRIKGKKFYIEPDKELLDAFIKMNSESFYTYKNIYAPNVLSILYINIAEQEFWRSFDADFFKAEAVLKKLHRIMKLYNLNISISWIETIKLGLEIFEALKTFKKEKVINKYAGKTGKLTELLTGKQQAYNISSDYAKLLFIKQEVDHPGFDLLINNFEKKIKEYQPEQFEAIRRIAKLNSA